MTTPDAQDGKCPLCGASTEGQSFGDRVRARRKELGLSQAALAEKVGVWSASSVAYWENGCSRPRPEHYRKLVEVLGL